MADLTHMLKTARRRELANAALHRGGAWLMLGCGMAIFALLGQRLLHLPLTSPALIAMPLVGLVIGIVQAIWTRPPALATAVRLDRALLLKDRIGSNQALFTERGLHID